MTTVDTWYAKYFENMSCNCQQQPLEHTSKAKNLTFVDAILRCVKVTRERRNISTTEYLVSGFWISQQSPDIENRVNIFVMYIYDCIRSLSIFKRLSYFWWLWVIIYDSSTCNSYSIHVKYYLYIISMGISTAGNKERNNTVLSRMRSYRKFWCLWLGMDKFSI